MLSPTYVGHPYAKLSISEWPSVSTVPPLFRHSTQPPGIRLGKKKRQYRLRNHRVHDATKLLRLMAIIALKKRNRGRVSERPRINVSRNETNSRCIAT